jgi:hypothetical protein
MPIEWTPVVSSKYISFEEIHREIPKTSSQDTSWGWSLRHPQTTTRYNPTVPVRVAFEALITLVNGMRNRWGFNVIKVDEFMEISPSHPYYQSIIKQKQDIIRQVKEGLAQIDRSISDTELLMHDKRRYKEILSYFAENDEHSLKAMFIDQVDVNLPEGVSMRSIAPRWPTIIADFQQLSDEEDTTEKIKEKIDVSNAEAVILATKVRLFKKWKKIFGEEVKQRYKLIMQRLLGRKASIEEYMKWVRPLIRRVYQMKEVDDATLWNDSNCPAGAGFPYALQSMLYWAWTRAEGLEPTEHHKTPREIHMTRGTGKALEGIGKGQFEAGSDSFPRFVVEPYDVVVKKMIPRIQEVHGVKITKNDVLAARRKLFTEGSPGTHWYVLIEMPIFIQIMKTREGQDMEDIVFDPISTVFCTQNVMLIKMLELVAEEKKFNAYIDELLGRNVIGENGIIQTLDEVLEQEFPNLYGKNKEEKSLFKPDIGLRFKQSSQNFFQNLYEVLGVQTNLVKGPYPGNLNYWISHGLGRPYAREVFGNRVFPLLLGSFGAV